jgi:1-deoxy-D-xylulose-5-phosphate synthase
LGLEQPIAIRYPRGRGITVDWKQPFKAIEIGTGVCLREGKNIAVLSIGTIAKNVSEALQEHQGVAHYDIRFIKPLDEKLLASIFSKHATIITVEDGTIKGGFGSAILEFASKHNYSNTIEILGVKDSFIEHGTVNELQKINGIDLNRFGKK